MLVCAVAVVAIPATIRTAVIALGFMAPLVGGLVGAAATLDRLEQKIKRRLMLHRRSFQARLMP
jgi:hypothetical protein